MALPPPALTADFASDNQAAARQCSIASSGGYPLVCPVTAVAPPVLQSPKPPSPSGACQPLLPLSSASVQPATLCPSYNHAHSIIDSLSNDYHSKTNTSPEDFEVSTSRFASVNLDSFPHTPPGEVREQSLPLPPFTLPNFLVPRRSVVTTPPLSQAPAPSPLIPATQHTSHLSSPFVGDCRQISTSPHNSLAPPSDLDILQGVIAEPRHYQSTTTTATNGVLHPRFVGQEIFRPSTKTSKRHVPLQTISLAELERRLSLASLPDAKHDYHSLVKAAAYHRALSKQGGDVKSVESGRPRRGEASRRRHSADSLRRMNGLVDTISSLEKGNPKYRGRSRTTKGLRQQPHLRDDVTADWSSIASTEESVSYYAIKKRGRGSGQKHRREGASFFHPPPHDALAPRFAAAPIYGPLLPALNDAEVQALTPVASRSLLTCSSDFKKQYPFVYQGLCKGILDIQRLIAHEIVVPIKEDVSLRRSTIRSRKAVTNAICDQLWRALQGKFPDPSVAPKVIRRMADYFYDKIEYGIQDAEDERNFLQWLFRFDVENAIDLRQNTSIQVGKNSVLCIVEGSAHLKRRKGDFFNMVSPDVLTLNIEIVIKALFLNGGHLLEINSDSRFIDRVSAGVGMTTEHQTQPDQQPNYWLPLESNPKVFQDYIRKLRGPEDIEIHDLCALEDWACEWLPKPVLAIIMVFPLTEAFAQRYNAALKQKIVTDNPHVWFTEQTIPNACGTIALLHVLMNLPGHDEDRYKFPTDGPLHKLKVELLGKNPTERGKALEVSSDLEEAHHEMENQGDTAQPTEPDEEGHPKPVEVNEHFVTFIEVKGHLYELDGRMAGPIDHGEVKTSFTTDAITLLQAILEYDQESLCYSALAVCHKAH